MKVLNFDSEPKGDLLIDIVKGILNCKKNSRTGRRCNRLHRVCLGIVNQRAGSLFPRHRRFWIHYGTFKSHDRVHWVRLRVIYQGASLLLTYLGKFLRLHASVIEMLWLWKNTVPLRHQLLPSHWVVFYILLKMVRILIFQVVCSPPGLYFWKEKLWREGFHSGTLLLVWTRSLLCSLKIQKEL